MCGIAGALFRRTTRRDVIRPPHCRRRSAIAARTTTEPMVTGVTRLVLTSQRLAILIFPRAGTCPSPTRTGRCGSPSTARCTTSRSCAGILLGKGHIFSSATDTEVIVDLYEEYGERCVERLRGMFAFALWDEERQELLLARDRFGIKPLYYAVTDAAYSPSPRRSGHWWRLNWLPRRQIGLPGRLSGARFRTWPLDGRGERGPPAAGLPDRSPVTAPWRLSGTGPSRSAAVIRISDAQCIARAIYSRKRCNCT